MAERILVPTEGPQDWQRFLADPDKHWKRGYSAWETAHSWEKGATTPSGFPPEVLAHLTPFFGDVELLLAIPEHKVPLPGGSTASQNDVWALAKAGAELVSIAVEGKAEESFDRTVAEWRADESRAKEERLEYLTTLLGLEGRDIGSIRYQFLHRTASAIIEAERFLAHHAVMLVHSFSKSQTGLDDFAAFAGLFGVGAAPERLLTVTRNADPQLHLGWVQG